MARERGGKCSWVILTNRKQYNEAAGVKGSSQCHCFKGLPLAKVSLGGDKFSMKMAFMPCACENCQANKEEDCGYKDICDENMTIV